MSFRIPSHTTLEYETARASSANRVPRPAPEAIARRELPPPKGKGGALWTRFYNDAVARAHPEPERLADALLRSREKALELEAKRHKLIVTDKVPKPQEVAVAAKPKKRTAVAEAARCKARTLEGKQCGFKATCGAFCKKHAPTAE